MSDQIVPSAAPASVLEEIGLYGHRAGVAAVKEILANDIAWQTVLDLLRVCETNPACAGDQDAVSALAVDVCYEFGIADDAAVLDASDWFSAGYAEGVQQAVSDAADELLEQHGD